MSFFSAEQPRSLSSHEITSLFKRDGFRSGRIVFPGIDMEAYLRTTQCFKYDGVVPDIEAYYRSLPASMRELLDGKISFEWAGFNTMLRIDNVVGGFMAIGDVSPRVNISNEAHEAAGIVVGLGLKRQLEEHFRTLGFPVSLQGLSQHEIESVAGVIGARIHGFEVTELYREQDPEAWKMLRERGLV